MTAKHWLSLLFVCIACHTEEHAIPTTLENAASLPKLSAFTGDMIAAAARVQILDVGEGDVFHPERERLRYKECQVRGEGLVAEDGWFQGKLRCGADPDYSFMQVSVGLRREAVQPTSLTSKETSFDGDEVEIGKSVKILSFSPEDELYPWPKELQTHADYLLRLHGTLLGEVCEVLPTETSVMSLLPESAPTSAPNSQPKPRGLVSTGDGWYGGRLRCKGKSVVVYQASVTVVGEKTL